MVDTNVMNVTGSSSTSGPSPQPFAITAVSFNARGDHFVIGTTQGFRIYKVEPFELVHSTEVPGGVKTIQLLNQGQKLYVALVGSGLNESYPIHKIVFWEANQSQGSSEINFVPEVLSIKSIAGVLVAGLTNQIRGFMLRDLSKFFQIKTCENPRGNFAVASHVGIVSVASPNIQAGTVHFTRFKEGRMIEGERPLVISAHQGAIACLALNRDGSILATASEQGTLIRLFKTETGEKMQEVRRGSESALIKHLSFEWDTGSYLTCCSDKHTIHIFKTPPMQQSALASDAEEEEEKQSAQVTESGNTRSYFSALSGMVSFAGSEWSFAQLRLADGQVDENSQIAASVRGTLAYTVTSNGVLVKALITPNGGNLTADSVQQIELPQ